MIKIDRIHISNMENAFHGLRNPMNSWNKSDSFFGYVTNEEMIEAAQQVTSTYWDENLPGYVESIYDETLNYLLDNGTNEVLQTSNQNENNCYAAFLGRKDLELGERMVLAGNDEGKFARQIFVSMDIDAPLYWWKELDTYKVGTVANSCSTMHKLASTPIDLDCFSFDCDLEDDLKFEQVTHNLCKDLEALRQYYNETKDKRYWRALIQLLPCAWNQKRTWTANYQVLRNIYFARRNHKVNEWHALCKVIEQLPYAKELIICEKENKNATN